MVDVYSIIGLFSEEFPGISPWGGYFLKGLGMGDSPIRITGQLVDTYGPSSLEGIMEKDSLIFRKRYQHCNMGQTFEYQFSLKNGIWQGEFSAASGYNGRALCRTILWLANADFKKTAARSPEEFARALVDNMIETGLLEISKDPITGEEIVKPR